MTVKYKSINQMLIVHNNKKSKYKFIIDWSAKSACTIVCKVFFDYMDELDNAMKFHKWIHMSRSAYYKKYGTVNRELLLSNKFIKIKFVRNPYSRAVSSYIHVMKKKPLSEIFNNEDMSFYTFLLNLKKQQYRGDIHYNFQLVHKEEKNIFDHIIKIENFENEIKKLNKLYNINLNINFTSFHHIKFIIIWYF